MIAISMNEAYGKRGRIPMAMKICKEREKLEEREEKMKKRNNRRAPNKRNARGKWKKKTLKGAKKGTRMIRMNKKKDGERIGRKN